jgi:hypothetical protein
MLLAEHALAAVERAPVQRQGPRRVAQRPQAFGQIVRAGERLGMLLTEHALVARQALRRCSRGRSMSTPCRVVLGAAVAISQRSPECADAGSAGV